MELLNSPRNRIIISLLLLSVLVGLFFYYNANFEINDKYPSTGAILKSYPQGKTVQVNGDFKGFYNGGFYLQDNHNPEKVIYKINSTYKPVDGDIISVLGILGPSYTITPQEMVVSKDWKVDFMMFRSFIIVIILIILFWRYWKFDYKNIQFFQRRSEKTIGFLNHQNRKFWRRK